MAIALAVKARWPEVPLVPLLLASHGPDWVDLALMIPTAKDGMAPYSHSIPAVVIGALLAALLYQLIARKSGAAVVGMAWLSHWPADLITGLKPIVGPAPLIGLDLYHLPVADLLVEVPLVVVASILYTRAFVSDRRGRLVAAIMCVILVAVQVTFDASLRRLDETPWRPSLANAAWRAHVTESQAHVQTAENSACLLHCSPSQYEGARHVFEGTNRGCHAGLPDVRQGEILYARRSGHSVV